MEDDAAPTLRPSSSSTLSSSSRVDASLATILDQLQYMCADFGNCLDKISDEMCQMNTRIGHIAHQQSRLGDFVLSPSLYPAEDSSLGGGDDDDEDASGFEYDDGRIASQ